MVPFHSIGSPLSAHGLLRPAFARRSVKHNDEACQWLRAGGKPVPAFRDHALACMTSESWSEREDGSTTAGGAQGRGVALESRRLAPSRRKGRRQPASKTRPTPAFLCRRCHGGGEAHAAVRGSAAASAPVARMERSAMRDSRISLRSIRATTLSLAMTKPTAAQVRAVRGASSPASWRHPARHGRGRAERPWRRDNASPGRRGTAAAR
jgi:hypothetical protein